SRDNFDKSFLQDFSWEKEKRFFISGNHENYLNLKEDNNTIYELQAGLYHIPRGYVSGEVLFIGGGDSVDRYLRTAGKDWFPEEALSQTQFNTIIDFVKDKKITTVIAHDLPYLFYPAVEIPYERAIGSHSKALEAIFNI